MGESFCALGPAPGHSGHPKHWAGLAHSQRIWPDAFYFYRNKRRLTRQFESNANHVLNMLRREIQLSLGFVQLRCQLFHLLAQFAFELGAGPFEVEPWLVECPDSVGGVWLVVVDILKF